MILLSFHKCLDKAFNVRYEYFLRLEKKMMEDMKYDINSNFNSESWAATKWYQDVQHSVRDSFNKTYTYFEQAISNSIRSSHLKQKLPYYVLMWNQNTESICASMESMLRQKWPMLITFQSHLCSIQGRLSDCVSQNFSQIYERLSFAKGDLDIECIRNDPSLIKLFEDIFELEKLFDGAGESNIDVLPSLVRALQNLYPPVPAKDALYYLRKIYDDEFDGVGAQDIGESEETPDGMNIRNTSFHRNDHQTRIKRQNLLHYAYEIAKNEREEFHYHTGQYILKNINATIQEWNKIYPSMQCSTYYSTQAQRVLQSS